MADTTKPQPQTTNITAVPVTTPMFEDSASNAGTVWDWHLTRTWVIFFERLRRQLAVTTEKAGAMKWCCTFNLATNGGTGALEVSKETPFATPTDPGVLAAWTAVCKNIPIGADVEIEIWLNDSKIALVTVPASDGGLKTGTIPGSIAIKENSDKLKAHVKQIGSTNPGGEMTIDLYYL